MSKCHAYFAAFEAFKDSSSLGQNRRETVSNRLKKLCSAVKVGSIELSSLLPPIPLVSDCLII